MGVPGWPPRTCPRPFSSVAPRRDECPLSRGNSNPGGPMTRMLVEGGRLKGEGKSPLVSSEDSFHIPPPAFHNKSAKRFWPIGLGK